MTQQEFQKYNPKKQYGIILLLAGENLPQTDETADIILSNPNYYPRSKKAAQVMQTGNIRKGILVTGGHGGLEPTPLGVSGSEASYGFLTLIEKIPTEFLYLDERSRETLGNFALPAETPMIIQEDTGVKASPYFNELESILLITEEGHMRRALECAEKVIPHEKMDYLAVEGPYKPDIMTKAYHSALMQATRSITEPNPGEVVDFLNNDHPFYKHGDEKWFKKPLNRRRLELALTCVNWVIRS